jgi:holo-[acyl-carrier protein] synthase
MADSIGIDIVDLARIERLLEKYGERLSVRLLGPEELQQFDRRSDKTAFLAGRFACKEALIKALWAHLSRRPAYRTIQILNDESGRPQVNYSPELRDVLGHVRTQVSISHDHTSAVAMALLSEE